MLQESISKSIMTKKMEDEEKLIEHTLRIKAKIESGTAIDKSIIDREAIKELNHKEAHSKAKVVKAIEHRLYKELPEIYSDSMIRYSIVLYDMRVSKLEVSTLGKYYSALSHTYILCAYEDIELICKSLGMTDSDLYMLYIHTFKYSSKSHNPKIGYKSHYECVMYINLGDKPVNHLLPNVIESTYAKDSRNLGFYTNLLLRSANAGDTILGINITNGNLIKAAQAMLCSTVIIPADNVAMRECEKTIKELQFK